MHLLPDTTSADAKLGGFLVLSHFRYVPAISETIITRMRRKEANG